MVAVLHLGSAAALSLIVGVGVALCERQLGWTIARKAAMNATAWLEHFSATIRDLETLLRTGEATGPRLAALCTARAALDVFRFKLFDAEGGLTFLSDRIDGVSSGGEHAETDRCPLRDRPARATREPDRRPRCPRRTQGRVPRPRRG